MNNNFTDNTLAEITFTQAKKHIDEMTLICGFLFDSAIEDEADAKIVVGNILKAVFDKRFIVQSVVSQRQLQPIDTKYHGIRLDVQVVEAFDSNESAATVYDMEMEDRPSDKKYLPKRMRYYVALHDSKKLEASEEYNMLPDYVSVVISSYDPFGAGDMYYNAETVLTTHPDIPYDNGIKNIFLYCNGTPNFDDPDSSFKLSAKHSKGLKEMLKYIVSGEKPEELNPDIEEIDSIVTRVKDRKEVTKAYMRQWDRELSIKRDTKQEDALVYIKCAREDGVSDDKIRYHLEKDYGFSRETVKELFEEASAEDTETVPAGTVSSL